MIDENNLDVLCRIHGRAFRHCGCPMRLAFDFELPPFEPGQMVRIKGPPERRFIVERCERRTDYAAVRWVVVFTDGREAWAKDCEAIDANETPKYPQNSAAIVVGEGDRL